jgi:hypothetical protein
MSLLCLFVLAFAAYRDRPQPRRVVSALAVAALCVGLAYPGLIMILWQLW